ncbi:PAAR domain-containing protein [Caulobacter segnis]
MSEMPAARLGDDVAHSQAGLGMLLGVLGGVVAGAVLVGATVATGGAALAVVAAVGGAAGLTSFGGLAGMNIGAAMMGPPTGKFVVGSPNVLVNNRPATMTFISMAVCAKEAGVPIPLATGSSTVFINECMAGREGEKLGCSAVSVKMTSPDVFIGGESAQDPRVDIKPEVPEWAVTALQVLGVAGAVLALPFAIATVGVAATIGGAVLGYYGAQYGGQAGRALGEALGMSEAGKRAMEAGGQFFGGMIGGAAGVKGVRAFNSRYQIVTNPNVVSMNGLGGVKVVRRLPPTEGLSPKDPHILFNKTYKGARPNPRMDGPNGGKLQANHGLQGKWAKENLSKYGYDDKLAPTETMATGATKPYEHTIITNRQNARADARGRGGQRQGASTLDEELRNTASDYKAAGYSDATVSKVLEQNYKMLDKLNVPYNKVPGY